MNKTNKAAIVKIHQNLYVVFTQSAVNPLTTNEGIVYEEGQMYEWMNVNGVSEDDTPDLEEMKNGDKIFVTTRKA